MTDTQDKRPRKVEPKQKVGPKQKTSQISRRKALGLIGVAGGALLTVTPAKIASPQVLSIRWPCSTNLRISSRLSSTPTWR
jgi:hypothetical protein